MKLKIYTYCCSICLLVSTSNIKAQPADAGAYWAICDAAIRLYNSEMDQIITDACDLLYMASDLPDFRDGFITVTRDSYHTYLSLTNPTAGGAYDAMVAVGDYFEASEQIERLQGYAMNDVADRFFDTIEGKDC